MAVILGGKDLAALYAAGMASGVGGEEAIRRFRKLVVELSGEEPEYGDTVEFNLGRINEHIEGEGGPYAPLFPLG